MKKYKLKIIYQFKKKEKLVKIKFKKLKMMKNKITKYLINNFKMKNK